jgi:uncharacterized membrane protein HdeD (DUF308 family)
MSTSYVEQPFLTRVRSRASHMMWLGAAFLAVGAAALVFPMVATLAATLLVGWVLIVSGAVTLFGAFSLHGARPFFGALLLGLLSVAAGAFILAQPLSGALAITLVLGALFMIEGAFELVMAFELRPARSWIWMLVSAIASIFLALVIIEGWPGVSLVALGAVLGVNFISTGLAYLFVGGTVRRGGAA